MSSVFEYIEQAGSDVVQTSDGLWWRVERVTNDCARRYGALMRLMVTPPTAAEVAEEEDAQHAEDPKAALLEIRLRRRSRWLEDEANRTSEETTRRELMILGVTHVGLARDELDAVRLVEAEVDHDIHATPPRVWIGKFLPIVREEISYAVVRVSTEGSAARIARFRNGG